MSETNQSLSKCSALPAKSKEAEITISQPNTQLQRIEYIWQTLLSMYGNRFVEMWKVSNIEVTKKIWNESLAEFSDSEIRKGLKSCLECKFPPSLPEFRELCLKGDDDPYSHPMYLEFKPSRQQLHPNPENLEKLNKILEQAKKNMGEKFDD